MQVQVQPVHQTWITYAVTIGIIAVIMAVRLRRMGTMRPLKLGGLWIVPAIYAAVAALMFVQLPPRGWVAIASAVGLAIGAAVGWYRGKMMHISVDPETHALNQKASPAAMMFLIALIAVRMAARGILWDILCRPSSTPPREKSRVSGAPVRGSTFLSHPFPDLPGPPESPVLAFWGGGLG